MPYLVMKNVLGMVFVHLLAVIFTVLHVKVPEMAACWLKTVDVQ